jgi:hypothetical protein
MQTWWTQRKLELQIHLREFLGSKPRACAILATFVAAPAALAFVIAMPGWRISHSAANLPGKTTEIGVEKVR